MATELLQIQPSQLTFVFELKKQSSCLLHLANNTPHHVAFKVKTTSPKRYCVTPTIGIINPHATSHFTVTMQAQRTTPPHLLCKDKFLIQSTVVPFGTTQDQISSHLFLKDSGKRVEEKKLRVVLITPPSSPVNAELEHQNLPPPLSLVFEGKSPETAQDMEEETVSKSVEKVGGMKQANDAAKLTFTEGSEELKLRLNVMDSKLSEAERTIINLNEEKRRNTQEKNLLKQELMLKRTVNMKRAQGGFPLLFVCVVALFSVALGYYIHP
ncbi:vesicle-associated protein 2-2-like isoform X2 [Abrus precatorius]|uniref:Vesicle-associated protein 2-2-like isoform X2 n=1 Tax=Abrus precatorius TaxID=3816 RepID=A0A8B8K4V0_ABRPR|nr:vesicle-associated protein 2-2-like isoform X2 [Abrus precatorius]